MSYASYHTVALHDDLVFIVDLDRGKSVTNDAENVVKELLRTHSPEKRFIYRDTTGYWDELCHKDGQFSGFAPYHGELPNV